MGFVEAIKTCIRKYFVMSGRAPRSEYWWFVLASILVSLLALTADTLLFGWREEPGVIEVVTNLALVAPSLTVAVRRLHDTDRSGFLIFAPLAGIAAGIAVGALLGPLLGQAASIFAGLIIAGAFILNFGGSFRRELLARTAMVPTHSR